MTNAINWFEIPVEDFERAQKFYSAVLGGEIKEIPMPDMKYGVLPYDEKNHGVGGAIVHAKDSTPSANGTTIYLNGGEDLSTPLSRVEEAGGKIIIPKMNIGENGFMAHFMDTEGNRVALHSMS